jgi:hypothetical protein
MEPHRVGPKLSKPRAEEKGKRFRIVKLEERIAPTQKHGSNTACNYCQIHTTECTGACGYSIE